MCKECPHHWIDQRVNTIMTKSFFVFFEKSNGYFVFFLYILVITSVLGDQAAILVFSI